MSAWLIEKTHAIEPPSGRDFDSAYLVRLTGGSVTRDVVIEFAAPSVVASIGYAEEVTRPYLRDAEPPEHLVVQVGGAVQALDKSPEPEHR
jgi:hypothetical protein